MKQLVKKVDWKEEWIALRMVVDKLANNWPPKAINDTALLYLKNCAGFINVPSKDNDNEDYLMFK